jgi:hypothetical protein
MGPLPGYKLQEYTAPDLINLKKEQDERLARVIRHYERLSQIEEYALLKDKNALADPNLARLFRIALQHELSLVLIHREMHRRGLDPRNDKRRVSRVERKERRMQRNIHAALIALEARPAARPPSPEDPPSSLV